MWSVRDGPDPGWSVRVTIDGLSTLKVPISNAIQLLPSRYVDVYIHASMPLCNPSALLSLPSSSTISLPLPSGKSRVPCVYRIYQRAQQVMSPGNAHLSSALVAAAEDWLYLTFMAP